MDLRRELSSGFQYQDIGRREAAVEVGACGTSAVQQEQALEERERERGGLARARDGRAGDVAAEEGERDARGLLFCFGGKRELR